MHRKLQKPPYRKIELTERDGIIIRTVDRYRLVTTDQLMRMTGSTDSSRFNSRLRLLWGADMLDRPLIQREKYGYAKKRPTLHALGQRGAEWMTSNHGIIYPKGKGWNTANSLKSSSFIDHKIGTTDAMLHFQEGIAGNDQYRFIDHHELRLYAPHNTLRRKYVYSLPTKIPDRRGELKSKVTKPDYPFAIEDRHRDELKNKALLFLEWDNATEDYEREDPLQSSIAGKYLCYGDAYKRGLHTKVYGFKNFRVLFVVNAGIDRVEKMIRTYQKVASHLIPAGAFLHTTMDELRMYGPYEPIWVTGNGEQVGIL